MFECLANVKEVFLLLSAPVRLMEMRIFIAPVSILDLV